MKNNERLAKRRKQISVETKAFIDKMFAISEQIDYVLKKKGISQKEFAVMMGKSESEISKWMSGIHNFTERTIVKIELELGEAITICPKNAESEYTIIITRPSASATSINADYRNLNIFDVVDSKSKITLLGEQVFNITIPQNCDHSILN